MASARSCARFFNTGRSHETHVIVLIARSTLPAGRAPTLFRRRDPAGCDGYRARRWAVLPVAPPPDDGSSFAFSIGRADASFYDVGNLVVSGGSVLGDPVAVRLTIDVRGSFLNPSEGTDQVWVGRNNTDLLLNRTSSVLSLRPVDYMQIDLAGFHVGDELSLYMRLTAVAGATNERELPNLRSQIADLGSTGHLYLDILSANAEFASASGHDYGSNLVTTPISPVPEPAPAALLAIGLCAILALKRKRRRHVSP